MRAIARYQRVRGCTPSGRELGRTLCLSPNTVWYHLRGLVAVGYVACARQDRSGYVAAGSIRLTKKGLRVLEAEEGG